MTSNGGGSALRESTGSMVWWDLQTVPPPSNHQYMDHLLASHRVMGTGLFCLSPPVKLRAHGTEPLADAAYGYIVKSKLALQQSISSGSEQRSTRCWKAMVVDMLLWATDHAPGKADVIVISKVFDRSMADVLHQLHLRNYNIKVATSFPPRDMTSLRYCGPPLGCKLLRQIFSHCDSLPNTADSSTNTIVTDQEALIPIDKNHEDAAICATSSHPQESLSVVTTSLCPQISQNCKNIIEEFLQKGISMFLEYDLYAFYKTRHGERLDYEEAGFEKLDAFLEVVVPGVNFTTELVGSKPWIFCSSSDQEPMIPHFQQAEQSTPIPDMIEEMRLRQSILLSDIARPKVSTRVLYYRPLTIEKVRSWLQELVACGRADTGINISHLGKDFEEHKGKKLNYKSLRCPTLMVLLSKFENLVRLERKDSMVILFPANMPSRNGVRSTSIPVNQPITWSQRLFNPPMNCTPGVSISPPAYTSVPTIVQVPGQNMPTTQPAPHFSVALNPTLTVPTANTVNTVTRPFEKSVPSASDSVQIDPAGEQASEEIVNNLAAHEPVSLQSSMASQATITDPLRLPINAPAPATNSGIKIDPVDGNLHLPNMDTARVPTLGTAKVNQAPGGENAKQKTNGGVAGSSEKFDLYSKKVVEEREAIKRTFESVNKRLQEEFVKRRKLAEQSVAEASNQANNTAK